MHGSMAGDLLKRWQRPDTLGRLRDWWESEAYWMSQVPR